jgi:CheY-like chemotaxis protein
MQEQANMADKRQYQRISLAATSWLTFRGALLGPLLVENISLGGAMLSGSPSLPVGSDVGVILVPHGHPTLRLRGRVLRQSTTGSRETIALAFEPMPLATEAHLQRFLSASTKQLRPTAAPSVLVVDRSEQVRRAMQRILARSGRSTLHAQTQLDAVRWADEPNVRMDTVVVGQALNSAGQQPLLRYFAEKKPWVHRVLLTTEGQNDPGVYCNPALADAVVRSTEDMSQALPR